MSQFDLSKKSPQDQPGELSEKSNLELIQIIDQAQNKSHDDLKVTIDPNNVSKEIEESQINELD